MSYSPNAWSEVAAAWMDRAPLPRFVVYDRRAAGPEDGFIGSLGRTRRPIVGEWAEYFAGEIADDFDTYPTDGSKPRRGPRSPLPARRPERR